VPLTLSGWSFTLTDLIPWSHGQLILISTLMAFFDASLLALLYRDWKLWLIQIVTLALAIGAMIATMKIVHIPLNLLNVLAFRLVLAIGVDYGIYVLLVWQKAREIEHDVAGVLKPVALAGLTAIAGFGSLGFANNPTLSGLGVGLRNRAGLEFIRHHLFHAPGRGGGGIRGWLNQKSGKAGKFAHLTETVIVFCLPDSTLQISPLPRPSLQRRMTAKKLLFSLHLSSPLLRPRPSRLRLTTSKHCSSASGKACQRPSGAGGFPGTQRCPPDEEPINSSGKVWFQKPTNFAAR
jgi:hypothetical protein